MFRQLESVLRAQGPWLRLVLGSGSAAIAITGLFLQSLPSEGSPKGGSPLAAFLQRAEGAGEGEGSTGGEHSAAQAGAGASEDEPTIRIQDLTLLEGDAESEIEIKITLSSESSETVSVAFTTVEGTASAPDDFKERSGTATFTPGATVAGVTFTVVGDDAEEEDERFFIGLSDPKGAEVADTRGGINLLNDDGEQEGRELPQEPSELEPDTEPPLVEIRTPLDSKGASGWYNVAGSGTDGVSVQITASDPSGVTSLVCRDGSSVLIDATSHGSATLSDGTHAISCVAVDGEGNRGAAEGSTDMPASFMVDQTTPVLACQAKPVFILRQPDAMVPADVTDATSGPASETATAPAATATVGAGHRVTVTGFDIAGNEGNITCLFDVIYRFTGFGQPLNGSGSRNSAEAGRAVPVKWRISDFYDVGVATPSSFVALVSYSDTCGSDDGGAVREEAAGGSGLQYHGDGNWQFNWKTPRHYAGKCRTMRLELDDLVSTRVAEFQFR